MALVWNSRILQQFDITVKASLEEKRALGQWEEPLDAASSCYCSRVRYMVRMLRTVISTPTILINVRVGKFLQT